jgi:hypothetical protein
MRVETKAAAIKNDLESTSLMRGKKCKRMVYS